MFPDDLTLLAPGLPHAPAPVRLRDVVGDPEDEDDEDEEEEEGDGDEEEDDDEDDGETWYVRGPHAQ